MRKTPADENPYRWVKCAWCGRSIAQRYFGRPAKYCTRSHCNLASRQRRLEAQKAAQDRQMAS